MRPEGWLFMIISWSAILALFLFSMVRTLKEKDNKEQNRNDR
jgi:Na+/melibiose symporter-like transporter